MGAMEIDRDLRAFIDRFLVSGEPRYYLDRHVRPVTQTAASVVETARACRDAVAMMVEWSAILEADFSSAISHSPPFAIIDDEWLAQEANASPPHVFVCISRAGEPLQCPEWSHVVRSQSGRQAVDQLVTSDIELSRVESDDTGNSPRGAWFLRRRM